MASTPGGALPGSCTYTVHVYFYVPGYYPDPATVSPHPTSCWDYRRVIQNTSTFTWCKYDYTHGGSGASGWFDDTDPNHDLNQESDAIDECSVYDGTFGALFAENMAARYNAWCANSGYSQPCWERDNDVVGTTHKFVELYSNDNQVWDLNGNWLAGGYGAAPGTPTLPLINVGPISGKNSQLDLDLTSLCEAEDSGGYVGIYSPHSVTLQTSDFSEINTIFNDCTG